MQYNYGLQHHQSRLYGVQQRHSQGQALGATSYHQFHLQQQQQQAPYRHDQHPSSPQRNAPAFQSSYQEHGHELTRKLDVYLLRRQGADTQARPHTASHLPHEMIHAGSVRAQALDARPGSALSQCRSPPPSSAEQNLRRAPQPPMYSHPPGLASGPSVVQDHASERTHHTPNVLDHEREQEGDRRRQAADSERMNWLTFLRAEKRSQVNHRSRIDQKPLENGPPQRLLGASAHAQSQPQVLWTQQKNGSGGQGFGLGLSQDVYPGPICITSVSVDGRVAQHMRATGQVLAPGDVVLAINGHAVDRLGLHQFKTMLIAPAATPGEQVSLIVRTRTGLVHAIAFPRLAAGPSPTASVDMTVGANQCLEMLQRPNAVASKSETEGPFWRSGDRGRQGNSTRATWGGEREFGTGSMSIGMTQRRSSGGGGRELRGSIDLRDSINSLRNSFAEIPDLLQQDWLLGQSPAPGRGSVVNRPELPTPMEDEDDNSSRTRTSPKTPPLPPRIVATFNPEVFFRRPHASDTNRQEMPSGTKSPRISAHAGASHQVESEISLHRNTTLGDFGFQTNELVHRNPVHESDVKRPGSPSASTSHTPVIMLPSSSSLVTRISSFKEDGTRVSFVPSQLDQNCAKLLPEFSGDIASVLSNTQVLMSF